MKSPRKRNQVRIIGGSHRRQLVHFADYEGLRPTADSVRERLFNWLGQDLYGRRVLDLFAGSGALGFEAASRGAASVVMVEMNRSVWQQLQDNQQRLRLPEVYCIHQEALAYLAQTSAQFDLVLLDPPYAWQAWSQLWPLLLPKLGSGAQIYLEAGKLPEIPPALTVSRSGRSGMSHYQLLLGE